ncbi:FtsX-like permease family protein [Romboutsia sedimentorum]|uniref:ABC transporter permease n=1 Tax=Romboutsia sedimentorum TaxID=1368474 RepID=UPI0024DEB654|nr:FtsX-like permease family protein [Romboutsia sedimentorum]MDK2587046.1 FtsX-like permease family protein [Romboutsia sedimentorum]
MINTTKIAKNNLKQNKSKSILIIITILLSTTLLAAVGMTCVDWSYQNKQNIIKYCGTQHGVYTKIDEKKYEEIKAHADIENTGIVNGLGIKEYEDETKIGISYIDDKVREFNNMKIIQGRAPNSRNEIMIDDIGLEKLGYEKKINQKIKIDYEDNTKKGITSSEFIVSGIIETSEMAKVKKMFPGVVSKEYMTSTRDMSKEKSNVFFNIKGADNLSGEEITVKIEKIAKDLEIPKGSVGVNEDYINTLKPNSEVMMWGGIISIVVILSSILVIYNIFYLSIVTKVQEFGKLRAIGATKKQIKSIVLKEGMMLSLIAIPIGIALGYIINEFILGMIFVTDDSISKLPISIGVAVISFITVFISLLKPMKVASKVSIIDAIRYNGEGNCSDKSREGYENINLKRLSYANLKRNKKRTYVTILSLSLSGIIFIVMASVMNSIDVEKVVREHFPYDIEIDLAGYTLGDDDSPSTEINILQTKNPLGKDFRKQLLNIDGVTKIENSKELKVEMKDYETEYKYHELSSVNENDLENMQLYLEDGKIDLEKLKSGEEVIISQVELAKETGIKVGDKITLTIYDGNKKIDKEFKVQAITSAYGTFLIHDDAFEKIVDVDSTNKIGIYVDENKNDEIKAYIKNLDKSNEYIESLYIDEQLKSYELMIDATKVIGYSLVIVIGVIGFMNLINSMISSIITRKKELGMLQAIGLTDKQLVKMLNIEAMFYTGVMLISSLTLGSGLGYIAVQACRKAGMSYAVYTFPIVQASIMVVCVVIAQLLLTYLISKNFNKESLIDRVRYSE